MQALAMVYKDIDLMDAAKAPAGTIILAEAGTGLGRRTAGSGNLVLKAGLGTL